MQNTHAKKSLSILLALLMLLGMMSGMTASAERVTYNNTQQLILARLEANDILEANEVIRFARENNGSGALSSDSHVYYGNSQTAEATINGSIGTVRTWTVPYKSRFESIDWSTLLSTRRSATVRLTKYLAADSASITMEDDSFVYNGEAVALDYSVSFGTTPLAENTDYTTEILLNGEAVDAVKDAGAYTLKVTGINTYSGTLTKSITVSKHTPTIDNYVVALPEEGVYTYDGIAKPEVTVAEAFAGYEGLENITAVCTRIVEETAEPVEFAKDIGVYSVYLSVPESDNIKAATFYEDEPLTFEITAATAALEYEAITLYETGAAQSLLQSVKVVPEGTIHFSLGDPENELAGIPSAKKAGDYTIFYCIDGTDNVIGLTYEETRQINVSILSVPTVTLEGWTFGDEVNVPEISGNEGEGEVTCFVRAAGEEEWTEWDGDILPVGDYELYAEIAQTETHAATATAPTTFSVATNEVAEATVVLGYDSIVYSGEGNEPEVTVYDGEVEIPAAEYTVAYADNVEPGTATVTVTDVEGGNYNVAGTATFTIEKIAIAPAVTMEGYTYGGEVAQPALTQDSNPGEGDVTFYYIAAAALDAEEVEPEWIVWEDIDGATLNAGDYYMKAEVAETDHYKAGEAEAVAFTVAKADIAPVVALEGWTYGDEANAPEVTGNPGEGEVVFAYYTAEDAEVEGVPENGGNYYVIATVAETTNYNGADSDPAEFTIAKKTPVKGEDFDVIALNPVYNGEYQDLVEVTVKEGSELKVVLSYEEDGSNALVKIPRKMDVGTYDIYFMVEGNGNYEDVAWGDPIAAKILPVPLTEDDIVAPTAAEDLVYDGTALALIEEGSVAEGKGTMKYKLADGEYSTEVPEATAAGTYNVYYKVVGEGVYADAEEAFVEATIAPKAITVTADAKTKTYGEADPELTYNADGLVEGDALEGALARAAGENVGAYAINRGTLANANYTIAFTGANLTIAPKAITVVADAKTKTYGEADPALTYTVDGLEAGDMLNGVLARAEGENVGTYTITQGTLANANYTIAFTGNYLTIAPKAITVVADAKTKTYGEADPALTYTVNGLEAGDALEGALARAAGENVGAYAINQGTLANANYTIAFTGAKLTILANQTALNDAIANAEAFYEEIKEDYPEIAEELKKSIDEVKDIAETEQQATIDKAVSSLTKALGDAKEQKVAADEYANTFIGKIRGFFQRLLTVLRNLFAKISLTLGFSKEAADGDKVK